ncbi:hypothetical protein G3578_00285 [Brevibacillus sp. SYP-B805]|uniref:PD-(D/E)XK nuclease family protein n=1 Tax=Brevibacillus sp. SYP-B805 TaxID=1578199 RepID=UPI0013E9FCEE|nr:PD-(D/E)XK nuclease family protein [Brevibacillus sp. SYP-B805]NGQ93615.1 hypothetical protein [Brevibacillus sp. SYP-B805]
MKSNFVNIVGYQFERVHTGVISWLLDTQNSIVPMDAKYEILRRIHNICKKQIDFQIHEIEAITCIPEYAFGRRRKIDIVVKIDLTNRNTKFLVIEMKVDAIPTSEQLHGTQADFMQSNNAAPNDVLFLLFLFGSAHVCVQPALQHFTLFRLPEILEVFAGLHLDEHIYEEWIESMKEEDLRRACIQSHLKDAPHLWDEGYWKDKGYRTWLPLFYYIYHDLKRHSKRYAEWDIYSGQNNPVMNWRNGWLAKTILGYNVTFYWEFNFEAFVLKVMLDEKKKLPKRELDWLRKEIADLCDFETNKGGRRTQDRYGTFNSLYKWSFDFKNQDFARIMSDVDQILANIHPKLTAL